TVWENPFQTSYFVWLDGGYSHGKDIYPKNSVWIPKGLFEYSDKVTFIEREPVKDYENKTDRLHKMTTGSLMGGFFAGGGQVLKELSQMQVELMNEWMKKGIIDDDQGAFMLLYFRKPSLFHLVKGEWNDVFKLFNVD
ncbi:protein HtrL, partial [Biomphalaria glabrata]